MSQRMLKLLTTTNKKVILKTLFLKELARSLNKSSNYPFSPYVNKVVLPLLSKRESENKQ